MTEACPLHPAGVIVSHDAPRVTWRVLPRNPELRSRRAYAEPAQDDSPRGYACEDRIVLPLLFGCPLRPEAALWRQLGRRVPADAQEAERQTRWCVRPIAL